MSPLLTKLRYKPGMRVCVLDAPKDFAKEVGTLPSTIERASTLKGKFDLVHAFVTKKSEVNRSVGKFKKALGPGGILWLSYPKGDAEKTDLKRDMLRELLAESGLESVAQVAIDETWSAMRFKVVSE